MINEPVYDALQNWVPYQLKTEEGEERCRWLYLADKTFTEPFFDETILHCRNNLPLNRKLPVLSSPEMLTAWSAGLDTCRPAALIFHVSRCGSTLLSQFFSQWPGSVVLSEVPFVDALLRRAFFSAWQTDKEEQALAALRLYSRPRQGNDRRCFIKTDSWHLHFHEFWKRHFPDTPRLFLYRHPAEVIRSQQKRRGLQSVPGLIEPEVFGFPEEVRGFTDLDRYMGMVLETYYRQMLQEAGQDPRILLGNYAEGMLSVAHRLAQATGEWPDQTVLRSWEERSRYHAKYPGEKFSEEPVSDDQPAWMLELVDLYEQLEALRLTPRPTS